MSTDPLPPASGENDGSTIARTMKFVVFSGIAFSVSKSINPFINRRKIIETVDDDSTTTTPSQSTVVHTNTVTATEEVNVNGSVKIPPLSAPSPQSITQKPNGPKDGQVTPYVTIDITPGDTLWGLSRKYGVSIDAIKQANGLSRDTIFVGRKLIIP